MLRDDDLDAAVEADVITPAQADAIRRLSGERRKTRVLALGREERFRLLGGFNDFFVAIGVLLLGLGLFNGISMGLLGGTPAMRGRAGPDPAVLAAWSTFGMLVFWGLAEFLTGRLKLVAPSIVIVVFLAFMAGTSALSWASVIAMGTGVTPGFWSKSQSVAGGVFGLIGPVAGLIIVCLHYVRFRLPFSLFVIAVSGVITAHIVYQVAAIELAGLAPAAAGQHAKWVSLVLGMAVFAWAMTYDVADPERTSRRADCGFWLHLLAAPLIVHPLAGPLINHPLFPDYSVTRPLVTSGTVALVFVLIAVLSSVALVIDRRALLVAGLGYLGAAMTYAISQVSGGASGLPILATLLCLGALIITLGVGWQELRAAIMTRLPEFPFKHRLPPYGQLPATV